MTRSRVERAGLDVREPSRGSTASVARVRRLRKWRPKVSERGFWRGLGILVSSAACPGRDWRAFAAAAIKPSIDEFIFLVMTPPASDTRTSRRSRAFRAERFALPVAGDGDARVARTRRGPPPNTDSLPVNLLALDEFHARSARHAPPRLSARASESASPSLSFPRRAPCPSPCTTSSGSPRTPPTRSSRGRIALSPRRATRTSIPTPSPDNSAASPRRTRCCPTRLSEGSTTPREPPKDAPRGAATRARPALETPPRVNGLNSESEAAAGSGTAAGSPAGSTRRTATSTRARCGDASDWRETPRDEGKRNESGGRTRRKRRRARAPGSGSTPRERRRNERCVVARRARGWTFLPLCEAVPRPRPFGSVRGGVPLAPRHAETPENLTLSSSIRRSQDRATTTLRRFWQTKRGVTWTDAAVAAACVGFVAAAGAGWAAGRGTPREVDAREMDTAPASPRE